MKTVYPLHVNNVRMFQTDNSMNYLARSANLPICFTFRNFFLFKLSKAISGSTGLIFTIFFSPNGRYLRECCQAGTVYLIPQGTLPWQPILGKISKMTFIQHPVILKRS